MRANMDVTVSEDDTFSGTVIYAYEDTFLETVGDDPETRFERGNAKTAAELPTGATEAPYRQDGYTGAMMIYKDTPLDEFQTTMSHWDEDDPLNLDNNVAIEREGDTFVVEGAVDLRFGDEDTNKGVARTLEVTISMTFPGKVTEATGVISGNTVTWKPQAGERIEISARAYAAPSATSDSPPPVLWIVLGAAIAVGATAVTALVVVRRKRQAALVSEPPAPPNAATGPAQQPGQRTHPKWP